MNSLKSYSFLVLVANFICIQAISQKITHHYYKYGVEEGLPSSEVYEVLEDKNGYTWFCTDAGVSRFNGYKFENFHTIDGLTDNNVFHMYEDYKGRIWFLPYNGHLCYYDKGSIYPYEFNHKINDVISEKWIRSIAVDSNETIHFVGPRYAYGSIDKFGKLDYQFYSNNDIGTVSYYQNSEDLLVYGLKPSGESTSDLFIDKNQKHILNYRDTEVYKRVICQYQLYDGQFLFFIGDKLCFKNKNGLKILPFEKLILNIYIDSKKQVWLSFINNGIKIYKSVDDIFTGKKPIKHLFDDKNVSGIYEDNSKGVWLAVQNDGAYYIPNMNIEVYKLSNTELTNRVSSLHKNANNDVFVGTFNSQIYQITENELPRLMFKNVLINNGSIFDFSIDVNSDGGVYPRVSKKIISKDGAVWIKKRNYFYKVKDANILFSSDSILGKIMITDIFEDFEGRIWAAGNDNLYIYDKNSLSTVSENSGLFQKQISAINQLSNGKMLGATSGNGLLIWSGIEDDVVNITKKDGLLSNTVRNVYIDKDDDVWLSTPKGISRLSFNSKGGYTIFNVTTKHGLPSNEVNNITSVNNIIWIATNKGLAKFDKHTIGKNTIAPRVHFEKVMINEEVATIQSTYNLGYNQNFIEFSYVGLSYSEDGNVRYRYWLEGIDKHWIETKTRFVRYPLLSEGDYIFHIQAANEGGVWSETKSISIKINPPYWKTIWFMVLCLIAFIGLLVLIIKQREIKRQKEMTAKKILEHEKLQTVSAELKALRSQMNPHFTFNTLSAIQTAVNNSDKTKASKYIGDFSKLIRKVLENSKHPFISLAEELEMLKLYIELEYLRFGNKFVYEIIVDEKLDLSYHEIPTMVIQPFVENAILHGLAPIKNNDGILKLTITLERKTIYCFIEDNGIGREEALKIKKRKGFAKDSMATRITEDRIRLYKKKMKKDFSVNIIDLKDHLDHGKGTRVELAFPV
ncbi:MAG: sensor histidine kinase [Crocinitomicaceae bacterium]